MPDQPKSHFERFLRPILASRFLTVSALIHLIIVLLFGGRVLFDKYVEPPDFQSAGDAGVSADIPPPPPDTPQTLPPAPTVAAPPPPAAPTSTLSALQTINPSATSFSMPLPAMAPPTISNNLSSAPAQVTQFGNGTGPSLPGAMGGRGNPGNTGAEHGQKPAAEMAVLKALRWLQQDQHTDGTWGSTGLAKDAFTGLALLCFLGHGETPQHSPEFSVVVTNAINAMISEGNASQAQYGGGPNLSSQDAPYAHGICTYALCEAYTMTKDDRLKPIVQAAIDYVVKGQRPDGGWAYGYSLDPGFGGSDTSVTGWQIQALKAAHLTGIKGMDAIVQPVMKNAMSDLDRVFDPKDGSFGYRKAGDKQYTLTGVGVLSKFYWLGRADASVEKGLKEIRSKDLDYNGDCNLYAWYYDTQACFQAQGGPWDWWNARFQNQLITNQSADGSWPITCANDPKAGGDAGGYSKNGDDDGALYRTTLCCLMLEVYYRYLPTDQESALSGAGVQGL